MAMDALRYYEIVVAPTIAEFERERSDRRRAFLACIATFHMCDYLALPKRNSGNLRQNLRDAYPDFQIIDRVAHASKHSYATNKRPLPIDFIFRRPPARAGQMMCGLSMCGDGDGAVAIFGERDTELLPAVKRIAEILHGKAIIKRSTEEVEKQKRRQDELQRKLAD